MSPQEIQVLGGAVIGYALQLARSIKGIPNWASYIGLTVVGVLVYVWVTPGFGSDWQHSWRPALAGMVAFLFQVRGQASASSDAKVAPPTNSL